MSYQTNYFDDEIVRLLQSGGVGFMPADTIYGLSCRALDKTAVGHLHKIKNRDKSKPFIVLISNTDQLISLGIRVADATPVAEYWPGSLTIVCKASNSSAWLQMHTGTLAVRQPGNKELLELMKKVGPIISTSANRAVEEQVSSVEQARAIFGDELDFYVDVGSLSNHLPSTIVRLKKDKLEVLREGAVKIRAKELYK